MHHACTTGVICWYSHVFLWGENNAGKYEEVIFADAEHAVWGIPKQFQLQKHPYMCVMKVCSSPYTGMWMDIVCYNDMGSHST